MGTKPATIAWIDHDLCAGVSMCTAYAPDAIRLNARGQSEFDATGDWTDDQLQDAADSCPMSAVIIRPAAGDA